jgi:hypothetical protein
MANVLKMGKALARTVTQLWKRSGANTSGHFWVENFKEFAQNEPGNYLLRIAKRYKDGKLGTLLKDSFYKISGINDLNYRTGPKITNSDVPDDVLRRMAGRFMGAKPDDAERLAQRNWNQYWMTLKKKQGFKWGESSEEMLERVTNEQGADAFRQYNPSEVLPEDYWKSLKEIERKNKGLKESEMIKDAEAEIEMQILKGRKPKKGN